MGSCSPESLARQLRELGIESLLVEPGRPRPGERWWPYPLDAWPLASLARYKSQQAGPRTVPVARPASVEEVARLVSWAGESGACLIPRGGGSGVLGAASWRDCCVVVDLSRLDHVRVDPETGTAEAGAGATVARVEEEARRHGLTLALEPQSLRSATIGGMIQTLGSGHLQPGVGNIEDVLLYVDVVLPTGEAVRAGSPRSVRGLQPYGMEHLFLGAEGTLGIIVGAGLRLRALPRYVESRTYRFPSVPSALDAARRLVQWNQPMTLRVIDEAEASLLLGAEGPLLILAYADDEDPGLPQALAGKADRIAQSLGGERVEDQYPRWHSRRYQYGALVEQLAGAGLWFDTIDLQATWPVLKRLSATIRSVAESVEGVAASFYHVSHFYPGGGSLYLTLVTEQRVEALARAWTRIMDYAARIGAAVTHHHGLGLQKMPWIWVTPGEGSMRIYCAVKRALDPGWVLNPHGPASRCRL